MAAGLEAARTRRPPGDAPWLFGDAGSRLRTDEAWQGGAAGLPGPAPAPAPDASLPAWREGTQDSPSLVMPSKACYRAVPTGVPFRQSLQADQPGRGANWLCWPAGRLGGEERAW